MADELDDVLGKLAKEVELAVHALYRGDMRQATAKARTGHLVRDAAEALRTRGGGVRGSTAIGTVSPASPPSAAGAAVGWNREDGEAVMKCVMAWLPMGAPASALPDCKCVAAGRELTPTWGERERARAALRKVTPA